MLEPQRKQLLVQAGDWLISVYGARHTHPSLWDCQ